jgi:hypothetical protein
MLRGCRDRHLDILLRQRLCLLLITPQFLMSIQLAALERLMRVELAFVA